MSAIVLDADVGEDDEVLEIGAGAGTLTEAISQKAKKVVSYEIDKELENHLESLNLKNAKFVFGDVMKHDLKDIESDFEGGYKIIANLPYYITTPIIFKFLAYSKKIESLCIMVQKEVAERMVAGKGSKDYGVLSIMIDFYGSAQIKRIVNREMFHPKPNVDSAICLIKIDREKNKNIDGEKFYKFIQTCFSMRRKTIKNNLLKLEGKKEKILSLPANILEKRPEEFSSQEFLELFNNIYY